MLQALNTALTGMYAQQRAFARHAERISRWETGQPVAPDDIAGNLVGLGQAKHGYAANLAVVRTADAMLGSLLDVLA